MMKCFPRVRRHQSGDHASRLEQLHAQPHWRSSSVSPVLRSPVYRVLEVSQQCLVCRESGNASNCYSQPREFLHAESEIRSAPPVRESGLLGRSTAPLSEVELRFHDAAKLKRSGI